MKLMKLIISVILFASILNAPADADKFKVEEDSRKLTDEFFVRSHIKAIAKACKANNLIISVRPAGKWSVQRLTEGAKAKPHTILEKSIKEKVNNDLTTKLNTDEFDTLKGFVGHYVYTDGKPTSLLGLRTDGVTNTIALPFLKECEGGTYIEKKKAIELLKDNPAVNAMFFYSGDYDLHEMYDASTNNLVPEGTQAKADALNALNNEIRNVEQARGGANFAVDGNHLIHRDPQNGKWAMFQHGDQATYWENQDLERIKNNEPSTKLVRAVVNESVDDNLAWYANGSWYITKGKTQNDEFRTAFGLVQPAHWGQPPFERGAQPGVRNNIPYVIIGKKNKKRSKKSLK
jgi:hypothetical protein